MNNNSDIVRTKVFFHVGNVNVQVVAYNKNYFNSAKDMLGIYGLVLTNFNKSGFDDFLEFLKDSVKNNGYLNDMLNPYTDEYENLIPMGEFEVKNYHIVLSGSYSVITNLLTDEKWIYYGD